MDHGVVAEHLAKMRGLPSVEIVTEFASAWLDNAKARFLLGWNPQYDTAKILDESYAYERPETDPRVIYYPG